MSKPRWIDGGVFRTLRTATRNRQLTVIVGPGHGTAEISSRAQLKEQLGDGDRATLSDDARAKSQPEEGLRWLHMLRQPGLVTTSVSDALMASAPDEARKRRSVSGPDSSGDAR